MARIDAAVARDDACECRDFRCRCREGRFVEQPRRQPEGAVSHRGLEQLAHVCQLLRRGGARELGHRGEAQGGVADQRGHVDGRLRRIHRARIGGETVEAERIAAEQVQRRLRRARAQRRQRDAAVADDHGGDALRDLGQALGVAQHDGVVVRVHVDEAGRDDLAAAVDALHTGVDQTLTDGGDAAVAQQHVAGPARITGAVDDQPTLKQNAHCSFAPQFSSGCVRVSMPWLPSTSRTPRSRAIASSPRRCATITVRISSTVKCAR